MFGDLLTQVDTLVEVVSQTLGTDAAATCFKVLPLRLTQRAYF